MENWKRLNMCEYHHFGGNDRRSGGGSWGHRKKHSGRQGQDQGTQDRKERGWYSANHSS